MLHIREADNILNDATLQRYSGIKNMFNAH